MKSKFRFIIVVLVILTVAAAAGLIRSCHRNLKYAPDSALEIYPVIDPDQVTSFRFSFGKAEVKLERKDGKWEVATSQNALASGAAVSEFLTAFAKTKPVRELEKADENILKKLNLSTDPALEPGKGTGIRMQITSSGDSVVNVVLGLAHVSKYNNNPASLTGEGGQSYDGRYVRIDDAEGNAHVFLLPRVFDTCVPNAALWLEPFHMALESGIVSLQYRENGQTKWTVFQNKKTRNYELLPAAGKLSLKNLAERMDILSKPFSGDIFRGDVSTLKFQHELNVICRNGLSYRLSLARIPGQQFLTGKLEIHTVPALIGRRTGESDENYEARKTKFIQEAESLNQAFSNRIYTVRPDLIDRISPIPVENKDEKKK